MAEIGYLLVGHGTRREAGQAQFRAVFEQFQHFLAPADASLAFLELAEPDIPAGVEALARRGVSEIVVVPVLLFAAGHADEDIPSAVGDACDRLGVRVLAQTPPLGLAEPILKLSAERFRLAVCRTSDGGLLCKQGCDGRFCGRCHLIMIGRGSTSESATRAMRDFARLRQKWTPTAGFETAFIHGQQPPVMQALHEAGRGEQPLVVLQPHLLFEGLLSQQLAEQVAEMRLTYPDKQWILADVLGVDERLPRTLAELARTTFTQAKAAHA